MRLVLLRDLDFVCTFTGAIKLMLLTLTLNVAGIKCCEDSFSKKSCKQ